MTTTDPTGAALYRAILADPDDDTARLVFADWLQEEGDDDRAEFIRVQCELATVPGTVMQAAQMMLEAERKKGKHLFAAHPSTPLWDLRRESALLAQHRERWLRVDCPQCDGRGWFHADKRYTNAAKTKCHACDMTGDAGGLALVKGNGDPRREVVFRRGFPDEVRGCRLADVFARGRERCKAKGCEDGTIGRPRPGHVGGQWLGRSCDACDGTGGVGELRWQPTPWLERIVRHHPTVEQIPLVDRKPYSLAAGHFMWSPAESPLGVGGASPYLPGPL